jgi:hypothetical protein
MSVVGPLLMEYRSQYVAKYRQEPTSSMLLSEIERLQASIPGVKQIQGSACFLSRWRKQYEVPLHQPPRKDAPQVATERDDGDCSDMDVDCLAAAEQVRASCRECAAVHRAMFVSAALSGVRYRTASD